ncbi:uncharacterized protein LTR77_001946 [Saxophila tyrrhenica]|uniref:Uncharacterized protein n=1 Tax=Saxophila tyrrhenica TaxID=1690608 RepID=A0AAV9PKP9_9PEZI|nr:hypothetical protein LTR77_001946 [Saxophila tyrrhenica]
MSTITAIVTAARPRASFTTLPVEIQSLILSTAVVPYPIPHPGGSAYAPHNHHPKSLSRRNPVHKLDVIRISIQRSFGPSIGMGHILEAYCSVNELTVMLHQVSGPSANTMTTAQPFATNCGTFEENPALQAHVKSLKISVLSVMIIAQKKGGVEVKITAKQAGYTGRLEDTANKLLAFGLFQCLEQSFSAALALALFITCNMPDHIHLPGMNGEGSLKINLTAPTSLLQAHESTGRYTQNASHDATHSKQHKQAGEQSEPATQHPTNMANTSTKST